MSEKSDNEHVLCCKLERKHAGEGGADYYMLCFIDLLVCELLKVDPTLCTFAWCIITLNKCMLK